MYLPTNPASDVAGIMSEVILRDRKEGKGNKTFVIKHLLRPELHFIV